MRRRITIIGVALSTILGVSADTPSRADFTGGAECQLTLQVERRFTSVAFSTPTPGTCNAGHEGPATFTGEAGPAPGWTLTGFDCTGGMGMGTASLVVGNLVDAREMDLRVVNGAGVVTLTAAEVTDAHDVIAEGTFVQEPTVTTICAEGITEVT